MRFVLNLALAAWLAGAGVVLAAGDGVSGRIVKVLPHFLDQQGRHALSPSLYERDAYQAVLRAHPEKRSGIRYDIEWKAKHARAADLRLRLELVTASTSKDAPVVIETPVKAKSGWGRWTKIKLDGDAYRKTGEVMAWRVQLLDAGRAIAAQQSFLW